GQKAENLENAQVVVISSAIRPGNPELDAARARGLPVVRRAEMLAELMRLKSNVAVGGTHGKTTTTSMVAALLDAGRMDPTVIVCGTEVKTASAAMVVSLFDAVGLCTAVIDVGVIPGYGSAAWIWAGQWMVAVADESDGTVVKLPVTIALVTNIDPEHRDHYG